jgi:hypothetical protein
LPISETVDGVNLETSVSVIQPETDKYLYPSLVGPDESATFWFVEHDADGNMTCTGGTCLRATQFSVCWGNQAVADSSAVEVVFYFNNSAVQDWQSPDFNFSNIRTVMHPLRPPFTPVPGNLVNFTQSNTQGTSACVGAFPNMTYYGYRFVLPASLGSCNIASQNCLLAVKVNVIPWPGTSFKKQPIGLVIQSTGSGSAILPPQGRVISSTATLNETTRKLNVFVSYPVPPAVLTNSIYSRTSITK